MTILLTKLKQELLLISSKEGSMNIKHGNKFRHILNADLPIQEYGLEQRLKVKTSIINGDYATKEK